MSIVRNGEAVSRRIEALQIAFQNRQFDLHYAVKTFTNNDATGQRGWGPLMQV